MQDLEHSALEDAGKVPWYSVCNLQPEDSIQWEAIPSYSEDRLQAELSSLAIIKLNGGLGTSMSAPYAKSLIPIRPNPSQENKRSPEYLNFLQVLALQIQSLRKGFQLKHRLPLFLMNSFKTNKDSLTQEGIAQINDVSPGSYSVRDSSAISTGPVLAPTFLQHRVPRLNYTSLTPLDPREYQEDAWCPPGHGDIFAALKSSGLLGKLIDLGYQVAFLSNIDNLGATVEPRILAYFQEKKLDWLSEVTPKGSNDKKGGILIRRNTKGGQIQLLERAQVMKKMPQSLKT